MRFEDSAAPRRNVGVGGWAVSCAQSRGECPGVRMTFLDGRAEGARVEDDTAREEEGACNRNGGPRRVDAADGGGLGLLLAFGRGRRALGRGGAGIRRFEGRCGDALRMALGSLGGGMAELGVGKLGGDMLEPKPNDVLVDMPGAWATFDCSPGCDIEALFSGVRST